ERTVKALGQVVGSLIVQVDDKKNPSLDPWCRLAEKAADHVEEVAWPLRALLYALYEKIESDVQRGQLGSAARKLLTHSLSSPKYAQLTGAAIGFVAETIASEPAASKKLLRRL